MQNMPPKHKYYKHPRRNSQNAKDALQYTDKSVQCMAKHMEQAARQKISRQCTEVQVKPTQIIR